MCDKNIQRHRENKKNNDKDTGQIHDLCIKRLALIFAEIRIRRTGKRTYTGLFTCLHQKQDNQQDTGYQQQNTCSNFQCVQSGNLRYHYCYKQKL